MVTDRYTIRLTIDGEDRASADLRKVNRELDGLDRNARSSTSSMGGLGRAAAAVGGIFAAQEVGRMVLDLQQLGAQASSVSEVFTQLAGGTIEADIAMQQLRSGTGGIVDDLTLMQGANSLLLTGLADTAEEAADLTSVAVRLGTAMGQDAASSIENFNAALLNNSFARLDTLGISAAAVRERVAELRQEGLDMSEAFSQATLEQGQAALEELGDAAFASETAVNRLATAFANARTELGEFINRVAEGAAQGVIDLDIALGGSGFGAIDTPEQRIGEQIATTAVAPEDLIAFAQENPDLVNAIAGGDLFTEMIFGGSIGEAGSAFEGGVFTGVGTTFEDVAAAAAALGIEFDSLSFEEQILLAEQLDDAFAIVANEIGIVAEETSEASRAQGSLADTSEEVTQATGRMALGLAGTAEEIGKIVRGASELNSLLGAQGLIDFGSLQRDFAAFAFEFDGGFVERGDSTFFNPDDLNEVNSRAEELVAQADALEAIALETEFEFVTEAQVAQARALANEALAIANNAEAAAEALENASLAQIAGQTSGGRTGEIFDLVLGNLDEEQQAAAQREFDLASGRETDVSLALEESFAPLIATIFSELGSDEAIAAVERLNESLTESAALGLSFEETLANAQQAIGFTLEGGGEQQTITIEAGDTLSGISAATGVPIDELIAANEGSTAIQAGQMLVLGDGTQLVPIEAVEEAPVVPDSVLEAQRPELIGQDPIAADLFDAQAGRAVESVEGGDAIQGESQGEELDLTQQSTDAVIIEEALTRVSTLDFISTLDPFIEDLELGVGEVDTMSNTLQGITSANFRATIPVQVVLDENSSAIVNSPGFIAAMETYFQSQGVSLDALRGN